MNKTIIDYLSFSGSPLLLERCKEMAKQRFTLSQAPNVFESQIPLAVASRENTKIRYFAENLAQVLGCNEMESFANRDLYYASLDKKLVECDMEIATDCTFNECYQQLISNIGIDMLDVLCHFEV
ncbi:replication protein, partial [Vibrio anguillarum]|nr:replication protein [Vibrio anguillarum]